MSLKHHNPPLAPVMDDKIVIGWMIMMTLPLRENSDIFTAPNALIDCDCPTFSLQSVMQLKWTDFVQFNFIVRLPCLPALLEILPETESVFAKHSPRENIFRRIKVGQSIQIF